MTQPHKNHSTIFDVNNAVATITLNQPKKHNAFDDNVINELLAHLESIVNNQSIRILVLKAKGKHFCAGADLDWMKRMGQLDYTDNRLDAQNLAKLMYTLNNLPIPTVVKVQGAAYGGAIGLIACCDIAIASDTSRFCLSEVKLGLAPATIGPYVVDAMGARRCRELFLTARVFSASDAYEYGLLHQVAPIDELDEAIENTLTQLLQASPNACKAAKKLIFDLSKFQDDPSEMTSDLIAQLRVSKEGQEGLSAFFEKRLPRWSDS